mgnify:CR=1 FL=1
MRIPVEGAAGQVYAVAQFTGGVRRSEYADYLVELIGISKSFGAFEVLKNVNFDVRPGEVHALLGENGAGKSTLMKILGGVVEPTEGTIRIGWVDATTLRPARIPSTLLEILS